jgi:hydrocephalus-inducing protein
VLFNIKGSVVGPSFVTDRTTLHFGKVSYNFSATRELNIENTSTIVMSYRLRMTGEDAFAFKMTPKFGHIKPGEKETVKVSCLLKIFKEYSALLVIDVEDVGENIMKIPVTAEVVVPEVCLQQD